MGIKLILVEMNQFGIAQSAKIFTKFLFLINDKQAHDIIIAYIHFATWNQNHPS